MIFTIFLMMVAGSEARQSCTSNSATCNADAASDEAALLQAIVVKHIATETLHEEEGHGEADTFATPQDLMGDCDGKALMTTSSMTGAVYDEVVAAVENILFSELDQTCDGANCQVADWAGCVLRMCGHDFMDFHDGVGGADACTDMNEGDNAGLSACLANGEFGHSLKDLYGNFCTRMSLADFEVIAAQAVMSLLATEGEPKETLSAGFKANFHFGRTTATGDACRNSTHAEGSLILPNPALGCSEVDRVFVNNMGLTWEQATALMGVHSLGRASTDNSGFDGYWMDPHNAKKFNNKYYTALIAVSWCPEYNVGGNPNKHQWKRCDAGSDSFAWKEMMLNTDMCLAYADAKGGSLIASPDQPNSNCCAWVHSSIDAYNMTDVIANNNNSFCNKPCTDYKAGVCGDGKGSTKKEELAACCAFSENSENQGQRQKHCMTPGLGYDKLWTADAQISAPAVEYVRQFAADRLTWINVFLGAWKKSTENGFGGKLTPLVYVMERFDFAAMKRCDDVPASSWGNYGKGTEEDCKSVCLDDAACSFVCYNLESSKCTQFATCDTTPQDAQHNFTCWAKQ